MQILFIPDESGTFFSGTGGLRCFPRRDPSRPKGMHPLLSLVRAEC